MVLIIVISFLSFHSVNYSQCQDYTKTAKRIMNSKIVEDYHLKILGACMDSLKTIHVTTMINTDYFLGLQNLGFSADRAVTIQTLEPFFTSVRLFFERIPDAQRLVFYFISYKDIRDKYGKLIEKQKNIDCKLAMNRSTVQKIDWEYVSDNLKNLIGFGDYSKLIVMLDGASLAGNKVK